LIPEKKTTTLKRIKMKLETVIIKGTLATLFILLFAGVVSAQRFKPKTKNYIGGGIENYSSGNWHGAVVSPYLNLTRGRNSFSAGPIIQHRAKEISGGKFNFSYNLTGKKAIQHIDEEEEEAEDYVYNAKPGILQLNVFCFGQYFNKALLSRSASETETKAANNNETNWNNVRVSTVEGGVGFELYVKFTPRISWRNFIAGSVYYHTNYIQGMYHEKAAPVLFLGTGIHICPL
jgi:hypothetical protein